jgi:mRNA interferase MazF
VAIDLARLRLGSVVLADFGHTRGREVGKRRPCIIHQPVAPIMSTLTVIPLTSVRPKKDYAFMSFLPEGTAGLPNDSWAKCDQVRTVSVSRLLRHLGDLTSEELQPVSEALLFHLGLMD